MEGGDASALNVGNINCHDLGLYQIKQVFSSLAGVDRAHSGAKPHRNLATRKLVYKQAQRKGLIAEPRKKKVSAAKTRGQRHAP
jgi:hypothetical protein